jgi:hypothetical protein
MTALFTVIMPLTEHRGQAIASIRSWATEQTLSRDQFELILVSNAPLGTSEPAIRALMSAQDSVIQESSDNEFLLYDIGARKATGTFLVFTEHHCVADSKCLEVLAAFFAANTNEAAICRSVSACENFIAEMEDRLHREYFARLREDGFWKAVAIRGFAIKRDTYFKAGGFRHEFSRYGERVLALELHRSGRVLGFASDAIITHHNTTGLAELSTPQEQFAYGELMYRSQVSADIWGDYLDHNEAWATREMLRPQNARLMLRNLLHKGNGLTRNDIKLLVKYSAVSLLGGRTNVIRAILALYRARLSVWLHRTDPEQCFRAYRYHWKMAMRYGYAKFVADYLARTPSPEMEKVYR